MVGIGIGIGINRQQNRPPSKPSENAIKAAIKERKHICATLDGSAVLIQPYALCKDGPATFVHGVVVFIDGEPIGNWTPANTPVDALTGVEVYNETFIPSDAFDASALVGVIAVIEQFNPFKDVAESDPSGS